jgi:hypothetical protein
MEHSLQHPQVVMSVENTGGTVEYNFALFKTETDLLLVMS